MKLTQIALTMNSTLIGIFVALALCVVTITCMKEEQSDQVPYINLLAPENSAVVLQKVKQIKATDLTVKSVLQKQCNKEVATCFEKFKSEFTQTFQITDQEWKEYQDRLEQFKKDSKITSSDYYFPTAVTKDFRSEMQELMIKYGINPTAVKVVYGKRMCSSIQHFKGCPVTHELKNLGLTDEDEHIIVYNHKLLSKYLTPKEILYDALTHEMMHLVHFDSMTDRLIVAILTQRTPLKIFTPEIDDLELKRDVIVSKKNKLVSYSFLSKARELRADVMAAAQEIDIAQVMRRVKDKSEIQPELDFDDGEHPTLAQRIQAFDTVITYLEAERSLETNKFNVAKL